MTIHLGDSTSIATATGLGSDVVKLQSQTGTDLGAALIFDNLDTATYRSFKLYFALLPNGAADGMYFNIRFRTGGSSGADDTNSRYDYGYQYTYNEDNQSQISRVNSDRAGITHTIGGGTSEGVNGFMDFSLNRSGDSFNTGNGGSNAHWSINYRNEVGNHRHSHGNGVYNHSSSVVHTGIKLYTGSGSNSYGAFANYKYSLYGLKG